MQRASSASASSSDGDPSSTDPDPSTTPPPPKKKRTRTLTTPHQSAVLHALLAKSRFPTTATREEVGRQIGLSARKVQIWFQNQRQKARRPHTDSAPLSHPPQFGPFPIATTAGPSGQVSPSSARSFDSGTTPLSGPAMPGSSHHASLEQRLTSRPPPNSPEIPPANSLRSSDSISAQNSRRGICAIPPRPVVHLDPSPRLSRQLPPLDLTALEPPAEPSLSATASFPPSRRFVNNSQPQDGSTSLALGLPPPFALQPQPQWDPRTFLPFTPPEFASWSHPSGSARSTFSAVGHSSRGRNFYTSSGEPRPTLQLDPPLPHHIIPLSLGQRLSTPASSSPASRPGHPHPRSDDEA